MSKANFDSPPISPKTPGSAIKCRTPRERGQKCNSTVLSHFFQKRPKTSPTEETQQDGAVSQCVQWGKIQTARSHNANDADLHSATAQLPVTVKEEPMDVGEASIQGLMSVKQEVTASNSIGSWDETAHSSTPSKDVKPVIKGEAFSTCILNCDASYLTGLLTHQQSHSFTRSYLQNLHKGELFGRTCHSIHTTIGVRGHRLVPRVY